MVTRAVQAVVRFAAIVLLLVMALGVALGGLGRPRPGRHVDGRVMSDQPIYCPAQTYRGNRFEPSEYCETEVEEYGDFCSVHDAEDRADEAYENYLESLRDE